jgi:hypothetical protein
MLDSCSRALESRWTESGAELVEIELLPLRAVVDAVGAAAQDVSGSPT